MSTVQGVLHVLSEPGQNIPEDAFHDWYNNEHGPDRMRLPGIRSGLRYHAIDVLSPPWLATYELDDITLLQRPIYTRLRDNRSPRETRVVSRMSTLDRSVYRLVAAEGKFHGEPGSVSVTVALTTPESSSSDLEDWYTKEHIGLLARIPGWLRSRLLRLISDSGVSSGVAQYLAIHEYTASHGLGGPEHKVAMSTPWRTRIMSQINGAPHRRVFSLHRAFSKIPNDLEHLPSDVPRVIDSFYPREDGVKLHYRLEGNPTGPVIAFSNSLLTNLHIWDQLIPHLSPKYQILRYDIRGHGLSTGIAGDVKISDLSSDILSLLSALNITRIHALIGVSLGGVTALHFALHNPASLSRLVAADCNIASSPGNSAAWEERITLARASDSGLRELARQTLARWFLPTSLEPQQSEGAQAVEKMILSTSLSGFERGAHALCDYDLRDKLPRLQVPALFVAGEKDGVLPDAMGKFAPTAPDARFVIVEDAGHLPMVENPNVFWDTVASFL